MRKFLILLAGVFALFYLSQNNNFHTFEKIINTVNQNSAQTIKSEIEKVLNQSQQNILDQTENPPVRSQEQKQTASIPIVSNSKYPVKKIQTYEIAVIKGKIVVAGNETPYGQYSKESGVILYIEEPRANKKVTVEVPFNNGRIYYEYPLTYTVGDVIINLDEYKNGVANDPNKVLGYAEFHLTDGDPYLLPSFMVQSENPTLVNLAQKITYGKTGETAKSRAIFEWVAKNIAYNAPLVNDPNPPLYSALQTYETRVVLCSGYADLSAALHRAAGIEAKVVYGDNHAWNEVKLNGVWQTEDPTYGSGFIIANTNTFERSYHPEYFYKSDSHKQGEYPF